MAALNSTKSTNVCCFFAMVLGAVAEAGTAPLSPLPLPLGGSWTPEAANLRTTSDGTELVVPLNYKIGRAVSPMFPASAGQWFTCSATVATRFESTQPSYYRCWLEIEFLKGTKVVGNAASPELIDTQVEKRLLGVTAAAPLNATGVRAVLCPQNKFWSVVDNSALFRDIKLVRLAGAPGGDPRVEVLGEPPNITGDRTADLAVAADWPDGTAINLTTDRGEISPTVLLAAGRAKVPLVYAAADVGGAAVTARVAGRETSVRVTDPRAATLTLESVTAKGHPTPVLVQLEQDGVMLPGRYQQSVQGLFVTPPWSVDLAPGRWRVRVIRGPQFRAAEQTVEAKSGQPVELGSLKLEPVVDLPAEGWYAGDPDGDVYHGELIYTDVSARTAAEIGRAMGLDWLAVGRWGASGHGTADPANWGEAYSLMRELSGPDFLFLWTDEKPKSQEGHACFVGLHRPDGDPFEWRWIGTAGRPLLNHEWLGIVRSSGGATFCNHPLRWWTVGTRFRSNMAASLPFDLCAAGRLDGVNINDKPDNLRLWSMLLDHGYRVAATAGADFCLDRPGGPTPGVHRMFCHCPDGIDAAALASAVRAGQTIVSTGPTLLADAGGQPPGTTLAAGKSHTIRVRAWARGDRNDEVTRLELWSHGKAIASQTPTPGSQAAEAVFKWTPDGPRDWVAVRATARSGWAMTSAYYAEGDWHRREPVSCRLTLAVSGLSDAKQSGARVEVWDDPPGLVTARKLSERALRDGAVFELPVTAVVRVVAPDGRLRDVTVYEQIGVAEIIERIAAGVKREEPLLEWSTYDEVLQKCRSAEVRVAF